MPMFSGEQMQQALVAYKGLQTTLDTAMPDQIMDLDGKKFRKKGYWRAVEVAFALAVECVSEVYEVRGQFADGRDNFGYLVTYKATAPNGRSVPGDGAAFAIEKAPRFKCPHLEDRNGRKWAAHYPAENCPDYDEAFQWRRLPGQSTEHNIRSHAHTRAFNRAVSNLVGFGEVSAEEVERGESGAPVASGNGSTAAASSGPAPVVSKDGTTLVLSVTSKSGTSNPKKKKDGTMSAGKPWTQFVVTFADGRDGKTFDKALSDEAADALQAKRLVRPVIESGQYGNDLKGFELVDMPGAGLPLDVPAAEEPAEPIDGPEKVLALRVVTRGDRKGWVIQTDKRELVTDSAVFASDLESCRVEKVRITPTVETVTAATGRKVQKLTGFLPDLPGASMVSGAVAGEVVG